MSERIGARLRGGRGCLMSGLVVWSLAAAAPPAIAGWRESGRVGGESSRVDGESSRVDGSSYDGRTSQGRGISMRVARAHVSDLDFAIEVVCPSRRVWQVTAKMSTPIKIVASRFHQRFSSRRRGASGTATITGRVGRDRVTGTVAMRRYIAPERRFCSGTAKFSLRRS